MKEQKVINILLVISNMIIWSVLGAILCFVFMVGKVYAEEVIITNWNGSSTNSQGTLTIVSRWGDSGNFTLSNNSTYRLYVNIDSPGQIPSNTYTLYLNYDMFYINSTAIYPWTPNVTIYVDGTPIKPNMSTVVNSQRNQSCEANVCQRVRTFGTVAQFTLDKASSIIIQLNGPSGKTWVYDGNGNKVYEDTSWQYSANKGNLYFHLLNSYLFYTDDTQQNDNNNTQQVINGIKDATQDITNAIDNSSKDNQAAINNNTEAIIDNTEAILDASSAVQGAIKEQTNAQKEFNDFVKDDTEPSADISVLGNVSGLLPPGPVDTLLNIPFSFLSILNSSFGGVCKSVEGTFIFDTKLTIPCFSSLFYDKVPNFLMIFLDTIPTTFLLIRYFKHLYKKIERAVSMETTTDDEWGCI